MHRRTFLATTGLMALAGCTRDRPTEEGPMSDERISYGDDPSQYIEVSRPVGTSRGTVVIIHGGFWKAQYDAALGRPLAASLREEGWTAVNVEYRRVGNGGGVPETLDDIAAAIDSLADLDGVDTTHVITLGHSAGGHLAVWAAARGRFERWRPARVTVTAAVAQAGVLDLGAGHDDDLGAGAVGAFVGEAPGDGYDRVDPRRQLPLDVPVRCVHGTLDDTVPISQSRDYVDAAVAAGADATLTEIDGGDHFVVIDPASPAWAMTLRLLADLV
ncbi:MAG: alpha/beta hydrolase [Nocardioides sp.]